MLGKEKTRKESGFVAHKLGFGLMATLFGHDSRHDTGVEERTKVVVENVMLCVKKRYWLAILRSMFCQVVRMNARLQEVALVVETLWLLDPKCRLPMNRIREACCEEDFSKLSAILDEFK